MDQQKFRIGNLVRTLFLLLWVPASTVVDTVLLFTGTLFSARWVRFIARVWAQQILFFGGIKMVVSGLERLDPKGQYIFFSNHQSALDIPALLAAIPFDLIFIGKKELFRIPFFGWSIKRLGHIWIDRENARNARQSITKAVEHLQKTHYSLILYPEGTRSVTGEVGTFKQGSFALPIESGISVVPVAIKDARIVLPKRSLLLRRGKIHVEIGVPIETVGLTIKDKAVLSRSVQEAVVAMMPN